MTKNDQNKYAILCTFFEMQLVFTICCRVNALNSLLFFLIDIMVQITVLIIGLPNGFYITYVAGVVN